MLGPLRGFDPSESFLRLQRRMTVSKTKDPSAISPRTSHQRELLRIYHLIIKFGLKDHDILCSPCQQGFQSKQVAPQGALKAAKLLK